MIILNAKPTDDLQSMITGLTNNGGGILELDPVAPYLMSGDWFLEDNVTINGNGATIDFQGGAWGIKIIGSDPYSTGTVAVNFDSVNVVGTGTTWDELMIGRYMLIGDFWYEIIDVVDTTHITLASNFTGLDTTGETYVIASTIQKVALRNITLQNSTGNLIEFKYVDTLNIESVTQYDADTAISGEDSSGLFYDLGFIDTCTNSIVCNNVPYSTFTNFTLINGGGLILTKISNTSIGVISLQNITGVGISLTNCYNDGVFEISIVKCSSHGMELVSANRELYLYGINVYSCGGDGLKLTATADRISTSGNNFLNNTGYGINIANANCDNNILVGNNTANNTAGAINDLGTGTLKSALVNNLL